MPRPASLPKQARLENEILENFIEFLTRDMSHQIYDVFKIEASDIPSS